jgi:hypothetical protein
MQTPSPPTLFFVALAALLLSSGFAPATSRLEARAQTPGLYLTAVLGQQVFKPKKSGSKKTAAVSKPSASASKKSASKKASAKKPASKKLAKSGAPPRNAKTEPPSESGLGDQVVNFIRSNATWILASLGAALLGVLGWAYLGSRRSKPVKKSARGKRPTSTEPPGSTAALHTQRFSSTKIQAADVNDRLATTVKTTEVETDREYALIVDEDALKMPPLPENTEEYRGVRSHEVETRAPGDASVIEALLAESNHQAAYKEYDRHVKADRAVTFKGEIEKRLSDQLLRGRELKKAAYVLEHYVATHGKKNVVPETFFNLGYIYFINQSLAKSRRFLKLFVETEKNPELVERATKILDKIKS